jgi:hypothetical protein
MLELHPKLHHLAALAHSSNRDGDGFKVAELLQSGYTIITATLSAACLHAARFSDLDWQIFATDELVICSCTCPIGVLHWDLNPINPIKIKSPMINRD